MSRNLIEMLRAREGEAPATALTVLKEAMDERMLVCDGGAPAESRRQSSTANPRSERALLVRGAPPAGGLGPTTGGTGASPTS
jgi:hypothetical protein